MKIHGVEPTTIKVEIDRFGKRKLCDGLLYAYSGDPGLPYNSLWLTKSRSGAIVKAFLFPYKKREVNVAVITDEAWMKGKELSDGSV